MFPDPAPIEGGEGARVRVLPPEPRRTLRLQVLSDIHFDSFPSFVPKLADSADAVVVAGDTCEGAEKGFAYLRAAYPRPTPIVAVLGNRAFHGRMLVEEFHKARALAVDYGITLLENGTAIVKGVRFIGATLWVGYDLHGQERQAEAMAAAMAGMADHRRILFTKRPSPRFLTPRHALALFEASSAYIAAHLAHAWVGSTVVVTHHAPSGLGLGPWLGGDILAAAYASRLDDMVRNSGAYLWVHGHQHTSSDHRLGGTRVVCNPRGTDPVNPAFDPTFVVEVPR